MTTATPAAMDAIALALQIIPRQDAIATIQQLQGTPNGAELLRQLSRDGFPGIADLIADALWSNL
jgi:hypothetical protein